MSYDPQQAWQQPQQPNPPSNLSYPPMVPGPESGHVSDGDGEAPVLPPEPRRVNLAWVIPAVAVGVIAVFAAGWYGGVTYTEARKVHDQAGRFEQVQAKCDSDRRGTAIADNGRTLTVSTTGKEDFTGLPVSDLTCVLDVLQVPQAVRAHMDQTRALDGRQTDSWEGFTASWSYHPDDGIELIVQVR